MRALGVETIDLTKRFGTFTALDTVSMKVRPGTVHALLGENGAGKSTLVKCLVGFQRADGGSVLVDGRETVLDSPQRARDAGIGMVYQHFTLVPSMTVAENMGLAKGDLPGVIDWRKQRATMQAFIDSTPFRLNLDARISDLSAGEKQKTEIVKQLYADNRLLILDEPTSVLTPEEADEVLGAVRALTQSGQLTVLMITHKFREVRQFADDVTVLRLGALVGTGAVADIDEATLSDWMIGQAQIASTPDRAKTDTSTVAMRVRGLQVENDLGMPAVRGVDLMVRSGEIVGIAGVSGNGQRELVQALTGQRARAGGTVEVFGAPFAATREDYARHGVAALPEEPLGNACVGRLSVAQNIALRDFDRPPLSRAGWLRPKAFESRAVALIDEYKIRTRGPRAPIATLSGGNVQRAVLARELSRGARLLIVMNPVFGLDFAAVAEIHRRIVDARNGGCGVLLVSEDLDELIELSDRVLVMTGGTIAFESTAPTEDRQKIGHAMGGSDGHGGSAAALPQAA